MNVDYGNHDNDSPLSLRNYFFQPKPSSQICFLLLFVGHSVAFPICCYTIVPAGPIFKRHYGIESNDQEYMIIYMEGLVEGKTNMDD